MYAYSRVHGIIAAKMQGRLCSSILLHSVQCRRDTGPERTKQQHAVKLEVVKGLAGRVDVLMRTWCSATSSSMSMYAFVLVVGVCICASLTPQLCNNKSRQVANLKHDAKGSIVCVQVCGHLCIALVQFQLLVHTSQQRLQCAPLLRDCCLS